MKTTSIIFRIILLALTSLAHAIPADTWIIGGGVGLLDPKDDIGTLSLPNRSDGKLSMHNDAKPMVSAEYFIKNNLSFELSSAYPFTHDIMWTTAGANRLDTQTNMLPVNVSLNYYFDGFRLPLKARPFLGVGANYSHFYDEKTNLKDTQLDIKDSIGITGQVGVDLPVSRYHYVRMNARYMNVKPDIETNDKKIADVDISPWVYGVSYVWQY